MTKPSSQPSRAGSKKGKTTPANTATREDQAVSKRPLHYRSILVPVDFSPPSRRALEYAGRFAEQFGARLIVVFVVEPMPLPDFEAYPLLIEQDALLEKTRRKLERLSRACVPHHVIEKTIVLAGKAWHEITEAALYLKTDLIIIATHGHVGMKHIILGSTTERVVRYSPCPVLTLHEKTDS
jgi:nucleotide-binding universal stress UspA family protein